MIINFTMRAGVTYIDGRGREVHIMGRTSDREDCPCWWSIQAEHYNDEGMRKVYRQVVGDSVLNAQYEPRFCEGLSLNIVREAADQSYWDGWTIVNGKLEAAK